MCISVARCCASSVKYYSVALGGTCLCSHIRCVCVCVCVCVHACWCAHVCLCVSENMYVCIWCMCSLYAPAASQHSPVLQESLLVCITHPPPLHHHCIQPGWVPTRLDLLTWGPKPGPASWVGMQVTQCVANATIWCLSPPSLPQMT